MTPRCHRFTVAHYCAVRCPGGHLSQNAKMRGAASKGKQKTQTKNNRWLSPGLRCERNATYMGQRCEKVAPSMQSQVTRGARGAGECSPAGAHRDARTARMVPPAMPALDPQTATLSLHSRPRRCALVCAHPLDCYALCSDLNNPTQSRKKEPPYSY